MGLGKTVQTIAFTTSVEQTAPYLIIGPTNVVYNWEKELSKFTKRKKDFKSFHSHLQAAQCRLPQNILLFVSQ